MANKTGEGRRKAGASRSVTVREMKMYRETGTAGELCGCPWRHLCGSGDERLSCMELSRRRHTGGWVEQEAGGETGHSHDRKSTSALMGTYRSLRWRAIQERYTITTQHPARLCTFAFSQSIFFFRIALASLRVQNKFCATLANGRWIAKIGPLFLSICNIQHGSWCQ